MHRCPTARVPPRAARGAGRARPVASSHQRARTVWSQGGCHGGRRPRSTPRSRPRRRCAPGCSPLWWQRRGGAGGGGGGGMSSRHGSGPRRLLLPAERARRAAGGEGRPTVKPRRPPRGRLHGTRCRRPRSPPWCATRARGARGGSDERCTAPRERRRRPLHAGARRAHSAKELLRPLLASAHAREGGRGGGAWSGSRLHPKWSQLGHCHTGRGRTCARGSAGWRVRRGSRRTTSGGGGTSGVECQHSACERGGQLLRMCTPDLRSPCASGVRTRAASCGVLATRSAWAAAPAPMSGETAGAAAPAPATGATAGAQLHPTQPAGAAALSPRCSSQLRYGACAQPPGDTQRDASVAREGKGGHRRAAVVMDDSRGCGGGLLHDDGGEAPVSHPPLPPKLTSPGTPLSGLRPRSIHAAPLVPAPFARQ